MGLFDLFGESAIMTNVVYVGLTFDAYKKFFVDLRSEGYVKAGHWTSNLIKTVYCGCLVGYQFRLHKLIPFPGPLIYRLFLVLYSIWIIIKSAIQLSRAITKSDQIEWMEWI